MGPTYEQILNDANFKDYTYDPIDRIVKGRATFASYFTMSEDITGWTVNITDYHNYDYTWKVPVTGNYALAVTIPDMLSIINDLEEIVKRANVAELYAPLHYADFNRYDRDVIMALASPYGSVIKICTTRRNIVTGPWLVIGGTPKMNDNLKIIVRSVRGDDK